MMIKVRRAIPSTLHSRLRRTLPFLRCGRSCFARIRRNLVERFYQKISCSDEAQSQCVSLSCYSRLKKSCGRQTCCCFNNVFSKESPCESLPASRNELQVCNRVDST